MTDSYPIAVCDPFNPRAEGAQVPDMYSFPSQTAQLRTQFTLSNITDSMDFVVQPNPFCTLAVSVEPTTLAQNVTTIPSSTLTGVTGGNLFAWSVNNFGDNNRGVAEYGLVKADDLAMQFSRFRVVGFGWRMRTLAAPLNVQGSVVGCQIPSTREWMNFSLSHQSNEYGSDGQLPGQMNPPILTTPVEIIPPVPGVTNGYNLPYSYGSPAYSAGLLYPSVQETATTTNKERQSNYITPTWKQYLNYYELPGVDDSGFITESIVNMPTAYQGTMPGLSTSKGLEVVGRISSPEAFNWHNSSNDPGFFTSVTAGGGGESASQGHKYSCGGKLICDLEAGVAVSGNEGWQNYNNQIVGIMDDEYCFQGGWSTSAVRLSGLNTTSPGAQFTLDIIMHIEGQPFCNSGAIISGARFPFYRPMMIEETVAVQAQLPAWRKIAGNVWDHVYANRDFYLDAARGLFGITM